MVNFKVHKLQNNNCAKPDRIMVVIHGYGDSGGGVLYAFNEISEEFQDFILIAPDGPLQHGNSDGYEWFALDGVNDNQSKAVQIFAEGVNSVLYLHEFLENEIKKYDIAYDKVFLVGFSQGAFVANHLALTSKNDFAGVLSISGGLSIMALQEAETRLSDLSTPFCLIHGAKDAVLPASMSRASAMFLNENNIKNELYIMPDTEHTISRQMMDIVIDFVTRNLK